MMNADSENNLVKQCFRCKVLKDVSEFHRYARSKDGLQSYCRPCKRAKDNDYYAKNPRRNYEHNKANAIRNRRWLHEYMKTKSCEWEGCGINDPDMLVLDHLIPSEKRDAVTRLAHQTFSLETIQAEVAKCRVLCANHHHKHTIQQFGYKKWLTEF